ncbi:zinc ribbon domain-containing protein [Alkaliphilus oremlandii]|uniref:DZANK-type domain-containing protein n=1 Tax=Alkaliphilus oremlandii (strain OhILAs) TaxID=350688 RepID=A8MGT0_ALKOO|nr:zinc ribbon domain-containing protein [Alkaliphilus oremlandii]ABW18624.1 hypothetical protein Clos_1077 [Alkaliphilus oremlandii OhILAs]
MPTIVCITLFLIMYFFLRDDNKDISYEQPECIACSGCGEKVSITYDYCPNCKEKLKEECNHCKKMININWRYCPYCGTTKENR